jgi:hypothetical protein
VRRVTRAVVVVVTRPVIHNYSDEIIRALFVRLYDEQGQHLGDTLPAAVVLSPHTEVACYLRVGVPEERVGVGFGSASAELFFTDADGRKWKKGRDQALSRQFKD